MAAPWLLFSLCFVLSTSACVSDPQRAVLWQGFGYSWDLLSHRIAYLRAGVAEADPSSITAQLGIVGGPWSTGDVLADQPSYMLRWREVNSRYLRSAHREWAMTVPAEGAAVEIVRLDFAELGFLGKGTHAIALQGVEWDTDIPQSTDFPADYDPADGWTPQGFGAGVEVLSTDDVGFELLLWSHFKPGPLDRDDMNAAVPHARIGAVLRFLLLELAPQSDPVFTSGRLEAQTYYAIDPPNTPHPPIPEAERSLTVEGQAGHSFAIPLLQSWDFELNASLGEEGRYLREFRAGVEAFDYDAQSGRADFVLDGFVSLASLLEEGDLEVEFSADVGLLQWQDEDASDQALTLSGTSEALGRFDLVVPSP